MLASLPGNLYSGHRWYASERAEKGKTLSPLHPQASVIPQVCCHSSKWLPQVRGSRLSSYRVAALGGDSLWLETDQQGGGRGKLPHPGKLLAALIIILPLQFLTPHGLCFLSQFFYKRGDGVSSDPLKAALGQDQ